MRQIKKPIVGIILSISLITAAAFVFNDTFAAPGINKQIAYQGILKTGGVNASDGNYDMVFKIYSVSSGGSPLWTGTHTAANSNAVTVTSGIFNVMLGSVNAMTVDFTDDTLYLGVTVGTDSEMTPRKRIGAAGYAFNSDALDGIDSLSFLLSASATLSGLTDTAVTSPASGNILIYDGVDSWDNKALSGDLTITSAGVASITADSLDFTKFADSMTLDAPTTFTLGANNLVFNLNSTGDFNIQDNGTSVLFVKDDGNVGIGLTSPSRKLDVAGSFAVGDVTTVTSTATGGTITTSGVYTIHTFTSSGTFIPGNVAGVDVEQLIVGGGGGGGRNGGGGGGAGGFRTVTAIVSGTTTVTVGAGGAGATGSSRGGQGSDSSFGSFVATGGGGGGSRDGAQGTGGSGGSGGGGGGINAPQAGGAGNTPATTPSQGNNGGANTGADSDQLGGGGGGAGAVGSNAAGTAAGDGGAGQSSSISGSSVTYAGGGGGGITVTGGGRTAGAGGAGGGGTGVYTGTGGNGVANTGGGGGGGGTVGGGSGGTGVVIIRYLTPTATTNTFVVSGGNAQLGAQGDLRFADADSSNYVAFQASTTVASNVIWTLPSADGSNGQVLSTNGVGALSWATSTVALDSLDFIEFKDAMTLDASTTIAFGTSNLIFNLDSTGYLDIQDNGTSAFFVADTGRIGIATSTLLTNVLNIDGGITFASTTPATTANALYNLGSALYWNGSAVVSSINELSDGKTDTFSVFLGDGGASDDGDNRAVAVGIGALLGNTSGFSNSAVGNNALKANTTGGSNSAFGALALSTNTTGANNSAFGAGALEATTGSRNSAVGFQALRLNTSGADNSAFGMLALSQNLIGINNTAIGNNALLAITGSENTGVGSQAGQAAKAVTGNTLIGYQSGFGLDAGGDYNTFLGWKAGDSITTGARNIMIGYQVDVGISATTTSDQLNIGNAIYGDLSTGNVGIGTSSPDFLLDIVSGSSASTTLSIDNTSTGDSQILFRNNGVDEWFIGYDDSQADVFRITDTVFSATNATGLTIEAGGNVGIGTTDPANTLHVVGGITVTGIATLSNATTSLNGVSYGWPSADGSNGQVLSTNGVGALSWATSTVALDSLDFIEFKDAMTLDASTTIAFGTSNFIFNLDSTGYLDIQDNGTSALFVADTGRIGIATSTLLTNVLNIDGGITFASTTPATTANALYNQGSLLYWNGNKVVSVINDLSDGKTDTFSVFLGSGAGTNDDGTSNSNTGVGINALLSNTSGFSNTAMGNNVLDSNTTGSSNSAFGALALQANTIGASNSAFGAGALEFTTGSSNSAVGYNALFATTGSENTGVGAQAGQNSGTVTGNTLIGYQSGLRLEAGGDYNTFLGWKAGDSITTGARNIMIGYNIDAASTTANDQLNIGDAIFGDLSTGNVGIGTTNPSDKFHIDAGSLRITDSGSVTDPGFTGLRLGGGTSGGSLYSWVQSYGAPLAINPLGNNVGIGTTNPQYQLELSTDSAAKLTSNTWTISSDERIKTDILDFEDGLDKVLQIRPITYKYNGRGGEAYSDTEEHIGIIAQELQSVAPYMVGTFTGELDGVETELLNYDGHALPFILVNAIQEQQLQIQALALGGNLQGNINGPSAALRASFENLQVVDETFDGNIIVRGHATFNEDTVGQAKILAGHSSSTISFVEEYKYQPIVTVTPVGLHGVDYGVENANTEGFNIVVSATSTNDMLFNWHAFGAERAKVYISDGTKEDVSIRVVDVPIIPSSVESDFGSGEVGNEEVIEEQAVEEAAEENALVAEETPVSEGNEIPLAESQAAPEAGEPRPEDSGREEIQIIGN